MFIIMIVFMLAAAAVARRWRGVALGAAVWAGLTTALHLWLMDQEGRGVPSPGMLALFIAVQLAMAGAVGGLAFAIRCEVEKNRRVQSTRKPIA